MLNQYDSLLLFADINLLLRLSEYAIQCVDDRLKIRRNLIIFQTSFITSLVNDVHALDQLKQFIDKILSLLPDALRHARLKVLTDLFPLAVIRGPQNKSARHLLDVLVGYIDLLNLRIRNYYFTGVFFH